MKRWTHGHSLAAGIAGGLLLAGHTIELVTVAAGLGFAAGYFLQGLRHLAGTVAYRVSKRMAGPGPSSSRSRPAGPGYRGGTYARRIRIAGVLDKVGRMLRDDEEIPF